MTEGETRWKKSACLKKNVYRSYGLAEEVAMRRVDENPDLMLGVYRCKFCYRYHLTSEPLHWGLVAIISPRNSKMVIDFHG